MSGVVNVEAYTIKGSCSGGSVTATAEAITASFNLDKCYKLSNQAAQKINTKTGLYFKYELSGDTLSLFQCSDKACQTCESNDVQSEVCNDLSVLNGESTIIKTSVTDKPQFVVPKNPGNVKPAEKNVNISNGEIATSSAPATTAAADSKPSKTPKTSKAPKPAPTTAAASSSTDSAASPVPTESASAPVPTESAVTPAPTALASAAASASSAASGASPVPTESPTAGDAAGAAAAGAGAVLAGILGGNSTASASPSPTTTGKPAKKPLLPAGNSTASATGTATPGLVDQLKNATGLGDNNSTLSKPTALATAPSSGAASGSTETPSSTQAAAASASTTTSAGMANVPSVLAALFAGVAALLF